MGLEEMRSRGVRQSVCSVLHVSLTTPACLPSCTPLEAGNGGGGDVAAVYCIS